MEIPSKINLEHCNIPSIIGGPMDYPFTPISFVLPVIPDFPPFTMPEGWVAPSCDIYFPPIICGTPCLNFPIISGPSPPPFTISITCPNISKISVNWGEPPQVSCVCCIQSPGTTYQEFLDKKESLGVTITTEEKCKAILQKIIELANKDQSIGFERDFGHWTATITKGKMHTHVGIPGKDGSFDILVNNLYDLLIKGEGLSWA